MGLAGPLDLNVLTSLEASLYFFLQKDLQINLTQSQIKTKIYINKNEPASKLNSIKAEDPCLDHLLIKQLFVAHVVVLIFYYIFS